MNLYDWGILSAMIHWREEVNKVLVFRPLKLKMVSSVLFFFFLKKILAFWLKYQEKEIYITVRYLLAKYLKRLCNDNEMKKNQKTSKTFFTSMPTFLVFS